MRKLLIAPLAILGGVGVVAAEPRFEDGVLSAPAAGRADVRARAYLAGRPDLVPGGDLVVEREGRERVRYRRHHRGVPIIGGVVTVRVDAAGRVRWASADSGAVSPDLSVAPTIDAAQAVKIASGGRFDVPDGVRLVIWAPPGRPARLAWDVDRLPGTRTTEVWRTVVDAGDGRVLHRENRVRTDRKGRVFMKGNPVTGGLTEVDLPLVEGSMRLQNPDIQAQNCIDTLTCPLQVGESFFRRCAIEPKAIADGNFDFLYDRPSVDTAPEDEFAEVQMFYHADRVLEKFRGLGLVDLAHKPMDVVVNYREPATADQRCEGMTSTTPLLSFDNAFYTSGAVYHGWPSAPSIVFGQGKTIDYAYDGDVVYHEFTHAVQDVLYDIAPAFTDQFGVDGSGGAMNEATADYFSSAITGDPKLGEYSGGDAGFIRDLSGTKTCPDSLTGEVHDDSEVFSSALWDVRVALPEADRESFDAAVYTAMDAFADFETFTSARLKIVAETRIRLGDGAADMAGEKMSARGLDGCNRRLIDTTLGAKKPFLWLYGVGDFGGGVPEIPAAYQFKVNLTKPADKLFFTVDKRGNVTSSTGPLHVILKPGSEPIVWDPDLLTHDGTQSVIWSIGIGKSIAIDGPFPAGPLVIQLSNAADGTWLMVDLIVFTSEEGVPATPLFDAGPEPMETGDGGCCQVGGGPGAGGALLLVGMVLLALRRRRR